MLYTESREAVIKFLFSSKFLEKIYDAISDTNVIFDPDTLQVYDRDVIFNEDIAILTLLAFRSVRDKLLDDNFRIYDDDLNAITYRVTDDDIHTAITKMVFVVKKIYNSSYKYYKFKKDGYDIEFTYDEEAIDIVRNYFINFLELLGFLGDIKVSYSEICFNEKESLKESLLNILSDPLLLDVLPIDLQAIIDNEYYTKTHQEFLDEKAMVSWFDIVNSVTEDQLDHITPIKLFIYEALGNKFPRWTSDAIKEQLANKIKELRKPNVSINVEGDNNGTIAAQYFSK
jgi:hypothetical protein